MSLRCAACPAAVEYGAELCSTCKAIVREYNQDLHDAEETTKPIMEQCDESS